jgi:hypothetical protein
MFSSLCNCVSLTTKNRCVPKSTSMYLNESTCSTKYSLNTIHKPTFHWNTDYVRHFNYVRQTGRHNLNFDVGGIVVQLVGKCRF